MLVIISDLHLTDGTTGTTITPDAFHTFRERLRDVAYNASWRTERGYQPIERIDLVLLGDVFDLIRSTRWDDEAEGDPNFTRPWDDPESDRFLNKIYNITQDILTKNEGAFSVLRDLLGPKPLTLPPATAEGRPDGARARVPVQVNTYYVVGNHDWFFHLPGPRMDTIRQKVVDGLGLCHGPGPFPHAPNDLPQLQAAYAEHRVFARHGDIYDPFNYDAEHGRNHATLGDAIVVELINRFPFEVRRRLSEVLPEEFLVGLNELANVRPSLAVPVWIDGLLTRTVQDKKLARQVKDIWDELAERMLAIPFVHEQDTWNPIDSVDILEATIYFTRGLSFRTIAQLVTWVQKRIWGGESSFARHALSEAAFEQKTAQYFIYGHTHHYEVVPLDLFHDEVTDTYREQIYFNSGTWHPLHETTIADPRAQRFVQYKVMTYLSFYKEDERRGRGFETWTGTLDH